MRYQFDRRPHVGTLVVSLESHNGANEPIECPIRMLLVANEIAFIPRRGPLAVRCMSKNNNACIRSAAHAHIAKAFSFHMMDRSSFVPLIKSLRVSRSIKRWMARSCP